MAHCHQEEEEEEEEEGEEVGRTAGLYVLLLMLLILILLLLLLMLLLLILLLLLLLLLLVLLMIRRNWLCSCVWFLSFDVPSHTYKGVETAAGATAAVAVVITADALFLFNNTAAVVVALKV